VVLSKTDLTALEAALTMKILVMLFLGYALAQRKPAPLPTIQQNGATEETDEAT